jgi:hypothetical protein
VRLLGKAPVTVGQAAQLAGCSAWVVCKAIRNGDLRARDLNAAGKRPRYRIARSELEKWERR